MKKFDGLSINGKDYKIMKISETNGGNLIVELLEIQTGDVEEMIVWKDIAR